MTLIDVVLAGVLLLALANGLSRGLLAPLGGLLGLAAGGLVTFWVVPAVSAALPSPEWRTPATIALVVGLPLAGASLGSRLGHGLRDDVDRTSLRPLERLLGGAAHLAVAALALSFVGGTLAAVGAPGVAAAVASSRVLRTIDDLTPTGVARTLAQARAFVLDDGLPRLPALVLPGATPVGEVDLDDPALAAAAGSVARVSGVAFACGTSLTGSGFVVAPDRVVTNAHVVAGVDRPLVELPGDRARQGRVVWFDPVDDLAVVAVDDLPARALPLAPVLAPGAAAVVQGYPYGGPFTSGSAGVLDVGTVDVPDVYGTAAAPREIYTLAGQISPGNSGGPLLTPAGEVAGVVFARAEDRADVGFAMTVTELGPAAAQAPALTRPVAPGRCSAR